MATRFYLPSSGAAAVNPAFSAEWEHQNNVRRPMSTAKSDTALLAISYSPDAVDHIANEDALFGQFISEPLAAQTIAAQVVKLQMQCSEIIAQNNLFMTWKLFLCNNDGSTIKETLLAIRRDGTEVATSATNRSDSANTSAADCEDGDRIVLEIGLGGLPTAAGGVEGHNGNIRTGDVIALPDLPEDDTQTGAGHNPWLEFADDLTFQGAEHEGIDLPSAIAFSIAIGAALSAGVQEVTTSKRLRGGMVSTRIGSRRERYTSTDDE